MTPERFNELVNGPLSHSVMPLMITRLALALYALVEQTGEAGERALEEICRQREEQDRRDGEAY
ncbi:MAG TPA: hypothetical protein VKT52_12680 [Ktedonobacterales bacterium]|nr:hypothetical protein [Ktedonobacterales bacterium]